ncbi:CocE/NonD family hydrolase [Natronomonas halophila]|uniref:CocE/NonD family hydrolase n=1 Tax=Natronomonas halophila TaxID=2747817 RepID=UPI0015B5CA5E|nr:CocE/NonD family hydrolase [Natronomonas halophila]QLD85252.1 CocE/NonD family hydrolase [Natronomonas halophila]
MTDNEGHDTGLSRRTLLRSAAAGTAGVSLVGNASADELVPDEPAPGPNVTFFGYDCDPSRTEHYTEVSREPTHDFGEEQTVELESGRDGEKIQIGVLWPDLDEGETAPVILRATPYISDLRGFSVRDCIRTRRLAENYVQQGYAVAAVAVRGTGGSGGCMELMGPNEQADVNQAVTWLGEHENSNENVAIIGRSYDGTTPWMAARAGNPYLATIVPFSGVPDIHDLMYKRGAPEQRGYGVLPGLYYAISLAEHSPASGTGLSTYLSRAQCPDNYTQGALWSVYAGATGEYDPSGYWTERVLKPGVARNYEGSILLVHGLQDWNVDPSQVYPWVDALEEAGIKTHIYFGQFSHRYPDDGRMKDSSDPVVSASYNPDWADYLLQWFESELKGRNENALGDAIPDDPDGDLSRAFEARVHAQNSAGEWYSADEWPPKEADPKTLYLGTNGDLRTSADSSTGSQVVYVDETREYDPTQPSNPEPGCRSCASFVSEAVDERLRIAGVPEVNVTATPTGPAPHLTAYLYAVDENDNAQRLGWGQVDLRYAQAAPEAGTVVPGEAIDVNIPIEPLDAVVEAGQRLALVLHQGFVSGRTYSPTPTPVQVETGGENTLVVNAWGGGFAAAPQALSGTRTVDSTAYTAGQLSRQTVSVEAPSPGKVRDVVPASWNVLVDACEDVQRVETDGSVQYVYFTGGATDEATYDYLLEAPTEPTGTGYYTFGPAQRKQGDSWADISGTTGEAFVVGVDT